MSEQIALIAVLIVCVMLVVVLLGARLTQLEQRIAKLSSAGAKLDLLLKHSGVEFDPYANLPPAVVDAVRSGNKLEAIKRYREATAVSLKEAKDFIEEVQRRGGVG